MPKLNYKFCWRRYDNLYSVRSSGVGITCTVRSVTVAKEAPPRVAIGPVSDFRAASIRFVQYQANRRKLRDFFYYIAEVNGVYTFEPIVTQSLQIFRKYKVEYNYGPLSYKITPTYVPEQPLKFKLTQRL